MKKELADSWESNKRYPNTSITSRPCRRILRNKTYFVKKATEVNAVQKEETCQFVVAEMRDVIAPFSNDTFYSKVLKNFPTKMALVGKGATRLLSKNSGLESVFGKKGKQPTSTRGNLQLQHRQMCEKEFSFFFHAQSMKNSEQEEKTLVSFSSARWQAVCLDNAFIFTYCLPNNSPEGYSNFC